MCSAPSVTHCFPHGDVAWSKQFPCTDLRGLTLRDMDLTYWNLAGCNLSGVDATRADLSFANLTGANLSDANLTGAQFNQTGFHQAKVDGVIWATPGEIEHLRKERTSVKAWLEGPGRNSFASHLPDDLLF